MKWQEGIYKANAENGNNRVYDEKLNVGHYTSHVHESNFRLHLIEIKKKNKNLQRKTCKLYVTCCSMCYDETYVHHKFLA